jgi:hypothetical protein
MSINKETGILHDYEMMRGSEDLKDPVVDDDISQQFIPEPPKEQLKEPLLPVDLEKSDQYNKEDQSHELDQLLPSEKQLKVEPKTVPSGKALLYQLGKEVDGDTDTTDETIDQFSDPSDSVNDSPILTSHPSTDTIPSSTPKIDPINDVKVPSSTSPSSFSSTSEDKGSKDTSPVISVVNPILTSAKAQEQKSSILNEFNKENSSVNV